MALHELQSQGRHRTGEVHATAALVGGASKLWSVFIQTPHALSLAYQGTVVLIEAEESGPGTLAVLRRGDDDRGVETRIGPFPRLDSVHIVAPAASPLRPQLPSYPDAELGLQLTFAGANLGGDEVTLRFSRPTR